MTKQKLVVFLEKKAVRLFFRFWLTAAIRRVAWYSCRSSKQKVYLLFASREIANIFSIYVSVMVIGIRCKQITIPRWLLLTILNLTCQLFSQWTFMLFPISIKSKQMKNGRFASQLGMRVVIWMSRLVSHGIALDSLLLI